MKHIVVIPTYNEAENIENLISELFYMYPSISILIVDDSSPDGTAEIVKKLKSKYDNLHLLLQDKKSGLAKAYINGFKYAIEKGFDVFTSMDADFSHNPKYLKDAVRIIEDGYDLACGSRYINNACTDEKNLFKNIISIGGNIYINLVLGKQLKDWTGGFNTYTKKALELIDINSIDVKGYIFQAQMKYRALKRKCRIKEFPIIFETRIKGKSKMSISIVLEAFFSVLKIKFGEQ